MKAIEQIKHDQLHFSFWLLQSCCWPVLCTGLENHMPLEEMAEALQKLKQVK